MQVKITDRHAGCHFRHKNNPMTGNRRRLPFGRARLKRDWSVEEWSLEVTCLNSHFPFSRR